MSEPAQEVLRLHGLHKSYNVGLPTEVEVLHGLDMQLARSDFTALIGASGSGKSTLLNLIGLLDTPTAGELFLLSNELDPANRNLSYEREFGRVMGLLDFMAKIVADRNGRGLSRLTHSVVSTLFLPVSFLK